MAMVSVLVDSKELHDVKVELADQLSNYKSNYHKLDARLNSLLQNGLGGDLGKKIKELYDSKKSVFEEVAKTLEKYEGRMQAEIRAFDNAMRDTESGYK